VVLTQQLGVKKSKSLKVFKEFAMNTLFYTQAPLMYGVPNLSPLAKPTNWQAVKGANVLKVKTGTYRNAVFEGVFLIDEAESEKHSKTVDGWSVAIVYCLWFGTRLKTRGIELKYQSDTSERISNYTGEVVANLSL
jgi:hypothetical protein